MSLLADPVRDSGALLNQGRAEEALKVKEREDHEKNRGGADTTGADAKKRKRETGLFDPPEEGRTPIEPRHIREAYRKLQATPQKAIAMLLHEGRAPAKLALKLVSTLCSQERIVVLTALI